MTTTFDEFLFFIIEDGIEAARHDYARDVMKRNGAIAGFEACRSLSPAELAALLLKAHDKTREKYLQQAQDYWFWRCREAEIEWVCNVVSAVFYHQGLPVIVPPTLNAVIKAAEILGTH